MKTKPVSAATRITFPKPALGREPRILVCGKTRFLFAGSMNCRCSAYCTNNVIGAEDENETVAKLQDAHAKSRPFDLVIICPIENPDSFIERVITASPDTKVVWYSNRDKF